MAGINKVILIGNLGNDPELRQAGTTSVCSLSVATTRVYTNRNNERVEETEWHRVTVWGKDAENAAKYLTKGRQVYIEGRLQTREYEDKDGVKRKSTDVVADIVQYLGGGRGDDAQDERGGAQERRSSGGRSQAGPRSSNTERPRGGRQKSEDDGFYQSNPEDDDLPF